MNPSQHVNVDPDFLPLIGEFAWHAVTVDPRIAEVSKHHYDLVRSKLVAHFERPLAGLRVMEVACYAHTTGYELARRDECDVTLFELSSATLRLGRDLAGAHDPLPRLVIGDFHDLPFEDETFDCVYLSSALHHTWRFQDVMRELIRVVAPGGLIFLENEPCLRRACFYKFRCNREGDFTKLEQTLSEEGWLRTVAEPYVGSRPETLFGMIENQRMPIDELIALAGTAGSSCKVDVTPEICMGKREHAWLQARHTPVSELAVALKREFAEMLRRAAPSLGPAELGIGFSLPSGQESDALAIEVANRLATMPAPSDEPGFRIALADLFGASVRLTIRRGPGALARRPRSSQPELSPAVDGIENGFSDRARRLLAQKSQLADLQCGDAGSVHLTLPSHSWNYHKGANGVWSAHPLRVGATLHCAPVNGSRLLVIRAYCGLANEDDYYSLRLRVDDEPISRVDVFHAESRLIIASLPPGTTALAFDFIAGSDGGARAVPPPFAIAYCGLFNVAN